MSATARLERDVIRVHQLMGRIEPQPGEILLLTGSTTLPFETPDSDVDLVLVTPDGFRFDAFAARRDTERTSEQLANGYVISYLRGPDGREIDLEVWPAEGVRAAIATIGSAPRSTDQIAADFNRVGGLDAKVGTDLMHALGWGVPVAGADDLAALGELVAWDAYLALKRDAALINVGDGIKGIRASLRHDRADEAYLKLCWAADNLVDALIFHHGWSITRWKWRLRYLPLLPEQIGTWYRCVRFAPSLQPRALADHADRLERARATHAGRPPHPLQRSTAPAARIPD